MTATPRAANANPKDFRNSATWSEIMAQPTIWRDWAAPLAAEAREIRTWIAERAPDEIWLSGAGTSAFIGTTLAGEDLNLRVIPTTDMVACPKPFLERPGQILSVQFGRSGNSSETLGMLDLLDTYRPDADRLHITCNPDGALAIRTSGGPGETKVLKLPEATHDSGFAMTSSFTTMLLSTLACLSDFDAEATLPRLADAADKLLAQLTHMDAPRPERAIVLGSGALYGVARESALKILELTAGQTIAQFDSTLGFRHGPKAAVDPTTAVFVFLHPDAHTRRYDSDLAAEIRRQYPGVPVTTIGPGGDIAFELGAQARALAALYVLAGQVLAVRWSGDLGLAIDDPFVGQNLTRVVSGVTLYPFAR